MNRAEVERRLTHWLEVLVIGEGLCPFAAAPMRDGRVRIAVCTEVDWDGIYRFVLAEVEQLLDAELAQVETSLACVPRGLEAFEDYLEMLAHIEAAIREVGLEGILQVASFHPDYVFAAVEADDITHYTNRSPYPVFHLIREAQLARALAAYPNPEQIPVRNQQRMQELGVDGIARLLSGELTGRD